MTQDFKPVGITYTKEQTDALNVLIDWSHKSTPISYTLEGSAGTGKTTILKDFINSCKFDTGIAVTAPTHKAVRVVSSSTGQRGVTIQKLLGLRPNYNIEDFNINNITFSQLGRPTIEQYNLIIIDEASMINKELHNFILEEAVKFNVKVLFVGDSYQLPPINEHISEAFRSKNKVKLTEIVRQSDDNPLLDLLEISREDVSKGTFKVMDHLYRKGRDIKNGTGYMLVSKDLFQAGIDKGFNSKEYETNIDYFKLTAYKNDTVLSWNRFIRSRIFKEHQDSFLIKDDLLTSYNTILDEFLSPIIVNSEDYIIKDMQDYVNESGIKGYIIQLTKIFGGEDTNYMFVVDTEDDANLYKFLTIANNLIRDAKNAPFGRRRQKWETYYKFKNSNLLTRTIYDDRDRAIITKDLDYGYALTVHKTQGSTYENVFVNMYDIIYNRYNKPYVDKTLRNKLIYVAVSRARKNCLILL